MVGTWKANDSQLYLDGVDKTSDSTVNITDSTPTAHHAAYNTGYFNGPLDEVRISNTSRSADWVTTEYKNQSAPSTFYALASEETNPATAVRDTVVRVERDETGNLVKWRTGYEVRNLGFNVYRAGPQARVH